MNRRRYLQSIGAAGVVGTAGCLDSIPGTGDSRTVLDPPEQDLSAASHPSHGDDFPDFSLPDPLLGEEISTAEFEGERAFLITFIYTNCPDGMCPALTLRLRRAQEFAINEELGDESAFLAMTFDPERDTEDALRTYATEQGVNLDAGNWHFLRPERYEEGTELMDENFGLKIEKQEPEEYDDLEYIFPHVNMILLVNHDGVVERAYPIAVDTDIQRIVDDFQTVVTA